MEYHFQHDLELYTVKIERSGSNSDTNSGDRGESYIVTIAGRVHTVLLERSEPGQIAFTADGQHYRAFVANDGVRRHVAFQSDARVYALTKTESSQRRATIHVSDNTLSAAMPGQVVKVLVEAGEKVVRGQTLVLLEAMKMEIRVTALHDSQVVKVLCRAGEIVERGQQLIELS